MRNLPKIEKKNGSRSDKSSRSGGKKNSQKSSSQPSNTTTMEAEEQAKPDLKPAPLAPLGSGRKNTVANNDLDPVAEDGVEE